MGELMDLTGRYWDWHVELWDSSTLRLIADNDLTYHHNVEVSFSDVTWAATADLFHHPTSRPATSAELEFARRVTNEAGYQIYAWDAETSAGTVPMMIIAASVLIVEGLVLHNG
jgi:hypothetical protein